jgi:hypothetical protein
MKTDLHHWVGVAVFALALAPIPAAHAAVTADSVVNGRLTVASPPATPAQKANGYLAKGQLNLALGKAGAAAADLEKAVRLKPTNAYGVLWLHFARNKEGAPDAVELQINAARVDRAAWPGPLLDYLTGKIDATTAVAKAGEGDDKARANRLCEADLFLGQEQLTKGRRSEGLDRLQAAANTCAAPSREAQLARADLPGGGPPQSLTQGPAQGPVKPVLTPAANRVPKAALLAADPTVNPASIRPAAIRPQAQPQVLAQVQTAQVQGDPLLRGSLR